MDTTRARRGTRFEITSSARDPNLQLVPADPYGSLTQLGIPIPSTVPSGAAYPWQNRYTFLLGITGFVQGETARLVGLRQRLLIGQYNDGGEGAGAFKYPVFLPVTTPEWHFIDATVSWHVRRLAVEPSYTANANNAAELMYRTAQMAALLYEQAPSAGGYLAPYGGQIPGDPFVSDLGNFHDLRFPWTSDRAWDSLDVEVRGPCLIAFFASVAQTNPSTRVANPVTPTIGVDIPEECFVSIYSNSVYQKIAGSMIFEIPNEFPENEQLRPCDHKVPLLRSGGSS